jgi:hypothetical protein
LYEEFLWKLNCGAKIEEESGALRSDDKRNLVVEVKRVGMSAKKYCFLSEE